MKHIHVYIVFKRHLLAIFGGQQVGAICGKFGMTNHEDPMEKNQEVSICKKP